MQPFTVVVEFDFVHSVSVASLIGYFEGIVRTAFSSQSELRSLSAIRLDFDSLVRQWRSATGKLRALAGHYIHESRIALDSDTPGTFFAKNGAIEYAITVRVIIFLTTGYSLLGNCCSTTSSDSIFCITPPLQSFICNLISWGVDTWICISLSRTFNSRTTGARVIKFCE